MKSHINQICKGAWFHLRNIGLIRSYLDQSTTERLVHSFVTSKLDCMNSLLYGLPKCYLEKLSRIHHAAARLIFLLKKRDHISPILKHLHWLPIKLRIEYKIILLTYKALNGLAPTYISELLHPVLHSRSLRSNSQNLLVLPKTHSVTYGDRRFSFAAPKLWNQLPEDLKSADSLFKFKKQLKTYLFQKAF